jgi:azurin
MKLLTVFFLTTALATAAGAVYPSAQTPAKPSAKPAAKPAAKAATTTGSKAARTVELTGDDKMKFDKDTIAARPGETLHIVLKNTGTMPKAVGAHNFVLLKAGTDQVEFTKAAFDARETDFIPPSMKAAVIANTGLGGPGETVETTFKVPAKPGRYPYVCSFPGHFALGMRGTLIVK